MNGKEKNGQAPVSTRKVVERALGLVGVVVLALVIWVVVGNGIDELNESSDTTVEQTTEEPEPTSDDATYTVRPGDNLEVISEETGIPVDDLLALNPEIDARTLPMGYELKLR